MTKIKTVSIDKIYDFYHLVVSRLRSLGDVKRFVNRFSLSSIIVGFWSNRRKRSNADRKANTKYLPMRLVFIWNKWLSPHLRMHLIERRKERLCASASFLRMRFRCREVSQFSASHFYCPNMTTKWLFRMNNFTNIARICQRIIDPVCAHTVFLPPFSPPPSLSLFFAIAEKHLYKNPKVQNCTFSLHRCDIHTISARYHGRELGSADEMCLGDARRSRNDPKRWTHTDETLYKVCRVLQVCCLCRAHFSVDKMRNPCVAHFPLLCRISHSVSFHFSFRWVAQSGAVVIRCTCIFISANCAT